MSESSPFLRHVLTLVSGTAIGQVIVFLMMMIITRMYGSQAVGELALFNSFVGIIVAVGAGRYDMALMLEHDDRNAKVMLLLALRLLAFSAAVATLVLVLARPLLAQHFTPALSRMIPLVGVAAFLLGGMAAIQFWFNRKTEYKTIALNRLNQQVGSTGSQVAVGAVGFRGLPGMVTGLIAGYAIAFTSIMVRAKDFRRLDTKGADSMRTLARKHWKMPVLNGPNALVDALRLNGINLLIGMADASALGQYDIANRVVNVPVILINSAVSQVFFQKLSLVKPGDMYREVKNAVVRSIKIGVLPFAALYVVAPWLLPFVFGSQWADSGYYAQALIPGVAMLLITSPISTMFVVTGTQHWLLGFAVFYAAAPLAWLWFSPFELLPTVYGLGAVLFVCLVIMTTMSLIAAKRYDRKGTDAQ
ncbi:lipopolysaccharide biosynthesis protein [Gleimia hominis]|uniref:lipopolysaccharide biosynthesis protein n=1 Tax=Gleimia hominis TaxID=595468 RepID=UPI001E2F19D2|nr:oligosaccharide flippase family protein [Gleimia hominis]WIK64644.1 oligosaccharide flippase family protein [Gleimia hominis]